ncbi:hypothetical protein PTSG_06431 [Salpingoeca rosetta]|uniref:Uncharacterized protein n=1 Tax=Salpingoeca rosetta (strain ATCC 50818 / BSB-021) TaxID=946362 RepID=F2UFS7_SALR5|nr:uncharacterized protein PTSG_06431 [Salpingoeca rosetta]EGD75355.1 hypothetical protein PTSG_06431 [Salpingoeca rosetta]|eukprot:XP_004991812.1 hypothetical protein PTSG_06431 [Salpingoeca rosetta]
MHQDQGCFKDSADNRTFAFAGNMAQTSMTREACATLLLHLQLSPQAPLRMATNAASANTQAEFPPRSLSASLRLKRAMHGGVNRDVRSSQSHEHHPGKLFRQTRSHRSCRSATRVCPSVPASTTSLDASLDLILSPVHAPSSTMASRGSPSRICIWWRRARPLPLRASSARTSVPPRSLSPKVLAQPSTEGHIHGDARLQQSQLAQGRQRLAEDRTYRCPLHHRRVRCCLRDGLLGRPRQEVQENGSRSQALWRALGRDNRVAFNGNISTFDLWDTEYKRGHSLPCDRTPASTACPRVRTTCCSKTSCASSGSVTW